MTRQERARFYAARELVVLDLLDHALRALDVELALEHPTLDQPHDPPPTPATLRRARVLARAARHLRAELATYCAAVDAALDDITGEDLPF